MQPPAPDYSTCWQLPFYYDSNVSRASNSDCSIISEHSSSLGIRELVEYVLVLADRETHRLVNTELQNLLFLHSPTAINN